MKKSRFERVKLSSVHQPEQSDVRKTLPTRKNEKSGRHLLIEREK